MKFKNYLLFSFLLLLSVLVNLKCQNRNTHEKDISVSQEAVSENISALPASFTAPADNPATPKAIELGRLLFYDPILSGPKDVACATCHHPDYGYAESQELSIGVNGVGLGEVREFTQPNTIPFARRNSHSVLNTAFNGINTAGSYNPAEAPMFWDLRVKSLEKQSLEPIKTFEEMRGFAFAAYLAVDSVVNRLRHIPEYKKLFREAFGGKKAVNAINLGKAIAAFERTLLANNSRFDQYMRGNIEALSAAEIEGMETFRKAGCAKCHNGPMLSDYKLHVLGVPENEKLTQPDASPGNTHAFRTPTLRNLRYTDPYMHNGTLATLQNVLEFYEDLGGNKSHNPHVQPGQLDPLAQETKVDFKDIQTIIEFLNTLNDDTFDRKIPVRVPSGLPVGGNIKANNTF